MPSPSQDQIADLWRVHNGEQAVADRNRRADMWDDTRTWRDPSGRQLSDRVWEQRTAARNGIDQILRDGIRSGRSAVSMARDLEQYLNPELTVRRTRDGRIIRDDRRGVLTDTPGRPRVEGQKRGYGGVGSYPARRLARTEITRAHGIAEVKAAEAIPFAGIRWRLSPSHPKRDICDTYANADMGLGRGVYATGSVPDYPPHPQCLCNLSRTVTATDDEVVAALRKKWDLGEEPAAVEPITPTPVVPPVPTPAPVRRTRRAAAPAEPDVPEWAQEARTVRATANANLAESDIRRGGAPVRREYQRRLSAHDALRADADGLQTRFLAAQADGTMAPADLRSLQSRLNVRRFEYAQARQETALSVLQDARPGYGASTRRLKRAAGSDTPTMDMLNETGANFPSEWWDGITRGPRVKGLRVNRGYQRDNGDGTMTIALSGDRILHRRGTAIHEFVHMHESLVPDLRRLEYEFYERRTAGEALEWMGPGYRDDETTRPDRWPNRYTGKAYGEGPNAHYEIASTGIEGILSADPMASTLVADDDDLLDFVFGILTGV